MSIVASQYVMDAIGVALPLRGFAARLDNTLYLRQSERGEVANQFPCGHQSLTQRLFFFFLLDEQGVTSFMELLYSKASRCL